MTAVSGLIDGLLPCRKCGSTDVDMWHGQGTQADLVCNECGQSEDVQVSDLLEYEERYAPGNEFSMKTLSYPLHVVEKTKQHLIEEWNKRV